MYYDIECPYCGKEQDIDHDDGYGYEENEIHQQHCPHCDKYFTYTTSISYNYDCNKADCLNDGEHVYRAGWTFPIEFTTMECIMCGETRNPTEEEWVEINKSRKNN